MPAAIFVVVVTLATLSASSAQASFGFKQLGLTFSNEDGSTATQAGSHPFAWTPELALNTVPGEAGKEAPDLEPERKKKAATLRWARTSASKPMLSKARNCFAGRQPARRFWLSNAENANL